MDLPSSAPVDVLYEILGGTKMDTSLWNVAASKSGTGAWTPLAGSTVNPGTVVNNRQPVEVVHPSHTFMHLRVTEIVTP